MRVQVVVVQVVAARPGRYGRGRQRLVIVLNVRMVVVCRRVHGQIIRAGRFGRVFASVDKLRQA